MRQAEVEPTSQTERFLRRWGPFFLERGVDPETKQAILEARRPKEPVTFSWEPRPLPGIGSVGRASHRMSRGFRP